jgi:hypothetical protein
MKYLKHILPLCLVALLGQGCQDFLDKEPLGVETDKTFYEDPDNAVLAVNGIYDAVSWDAGGILGGGNNSEWMFGDLLSDDAVKGSTPGDYLELKQMERWETLPNADIPRTSWNNMFATIYRANQVIKYLPGSSISSVLKNRLLGEAYFLRGYAYHNLVIKFGGVPLLEEPIQSSQWGQVKRASIAETYAFIEADLLKAIELLPERSQYGGTDLGRASKGAARAFLARSYMYELGTDNTNGRTWQNVYDQTSAIIASSQYQLDPNYARLFEPEGENGLESIFELQYMDNNVGWGPPKAGTANDVIQNNRATWGWGFNNPTQDLVNEFEPNDPRLPVTVYKNGDIVVGEAQTIDPAQNETGYLNRKAFVDPASRPRESQNGPKNIRLFRYADVLLMQAEAAAHLNKEPEAVALVNQVRQRARTSTRPKGSTAVGATDYQPYASTAGVLPDLQASLSGQALIDAIWHERRVELGMESRRYYDLVRTGRYLEALNKKDPTGAARTNAERHSLTGFVNPIPVITIPLNEVQSWNLSQNPGY